MKLANSSSELVKSMIEGRYNPFALGKFLKHLGSKFKKSDTLTVTIKVPLTVEIYEFEYEKGITREAKISQPDRKAIETQIHSQIIKGLNKSSDFSKFKFVVS